MVQITQVDAALYRLPVEMPYRDEPIQSTYVITTIETDDGPTGYGITGMLWQRSTKEFINTEIAPLLIGQSPTDTGRIREVLRSELNARYQTGVWCTAVSAVDIALWDINGKRFGEPIWRLLGGAQDTVETYITCGLLEHTDEQVVAVAEEFVADGETRLKLRVGGPDPDPRTDARRVQAVREAVGPEIELMIDANHSYSLNEALELANRVAPHVITWFEEPIQANDLDLLADFRRRSSIPTAVGQNEGDPIRHREFMSRGAVDISQPNVCFVGGFTGGRQVALTAKSFNHKIANGASYPHLNMHLQAGMTNGWRVEFHDHGTRAAEMLFEDPPASENGHVTLPTAPGLGVSIDWATIEEYRVG
ncbi:MAG: mandelate racemase/muconate lactonizing enzyme family protein [Halobacteriales archaeon]|nr:mandelate racemase/muconate lactonizing enzyme family protein [Halobacteriales archaeon]